jgi:hypothetical protein
LTTVRVNAAILALAGVLVLVLITLLLGLPQRIRRGEDGQAAIQMLDTMRRPFLEIRQAETRLLQTLDAESGSRALAIAADSAGSLLGRYQALARYSAPLSRNVAGLSDTFQDWVVVERRLFGCVGARSAAPAGTPSESCLVPDLASAADGFLRTMNKLGAGETPIHADIADGRTASHILQALLGILLLYLTGLAFWSQRTKGKRERVLLQERLRAEQEARTLEKALAEALTKVLSGFISICASCKRVRGPHNEWSPVETYVTNKTDAQFSHGICPGCKQQLYGDFSSPRSGGLS